MGMPKSQPAKPKSDWIVHEDKDLRIPDATPEELAKRVLTGGARRRPESVKPVD